MIAVGAVVSLSAASFAAVIHVPADQPTIQAGIDSASNGDTVLVADGTYTGGGNRDIDFGGKGVVLKSENGPDFTIIDSQGDSLDPHRGFYFHSGEDSAAVVDGFTIQGGYGLYDDPNGYSVGGGIKCDSSSSPSLINNTISGNSASWSGGGIYCNSSSNPTISDNTISGNSGGSGGGVSCFVTNPTISNNTINGNSASVGGGIYCIFSNSTISNNTINGNSAERAGGICCDIFSSPTISNNTINGNSASIGGGINCHYSSPTISNNIIAFSSQGEAIYGYRSSPVLTCCDVYGNEGGDWVGCIADQADTNGNSSADPLFCDTSLGWLNIDSLSPCAPDNNDCDTLIGSMDVGCICVDNDGDGFGDPGYPESTCPVDNCPDTANPDQADTDSNGVGDACCCVDRGNADGNGAVNVSDLTYLVNYLFKGGNSPPCPEEGNVDDTGTINVADLTYLVNYLFKGGPPPAPCP